MRIFISWSGGRSGALAAFLHQWIQDVIQFAEPWMSANDIDAGARWNRSIEEQLKETQFGILCLTKSNLNSPWILFEAGALAKTIEDTFVCPYLIDLDTTEIPRGPLTQFQAKKATEAGTWELVRTINRALGDNTLSEDRLRRMFDRCWPDLAAALENLPAEQVVQGPPPDVGEMVKEILDLVRALSRRNSSDVTIIDRLDLIKSLEDSMDNPTEPRHPFVAGASGTGKSRSLGELIEKLYPEKRREPQTFSMAESLLEVELNKRGIEHKANYRIDNYVLDFYFDMNGVRLDVEIDGNERITDSNKIGRDRMRNNSLQSQGINILRFPVSEVINNVEACVDKIEKALLTIDSEKGE